MPMDPKSRSFSNLQGEFLLRKSSLVPFYTIPTIKIDEWVLQQHVRIIKFAHKE